MASQAPCRDHWGRLSSPVMVGRDQELELLLSAVSRSPSLVMVEGESGVGKTRLVQEMLARPDLRGRHRLTGRCYEFAEPFPFGPLWEALRGVRPPAGLPVVTGALRTHLPELAAALPEAPPPLADYAAERHRVFRGLLALLAALGPTVLVLDDLHWADQATADFLRFLVLHQPAELTVVGTYRREDLAETSPLPTLDAGLPADRMSVRIGLLPLKGAQVRELVHTILDTAENSDALADHLAERTAGLPLAIEEVLLLLRQRPDVAPEPGALLRHRLDALAVPPKLRDAITERLYRLGPAARAVAHAAAVYARPVDEPTLTALTGLDDIAGGDALAQALGSALLVVAGDDRYGFRHALARQAVEESVSPPLRRRLHLRAARLLERRPDRPLALLAHHYRAAGLTAKWVRYAEAAADRAFSLNDHAAAYALLRDAVAVADISPVTRGSLAVRLARHAARCRAYQDAITVLRPLLDDAAIPRRLRGRVRFWVGRLLHDTGESHAARDAGLAALDELDGQALAQVLAWLATVPWGFDPIPVRLDWLDRAHAIASRSGDGALKIEIAASRVALLASTGNPAYWRALREMPAPGTAPGEIEQAIRGYGNIADALLHTGHYAPAREYVERAAELAEAHSPSFAVYSDLNAMQLDLLVGRWDGLDERLETLVAATEDWPTGRQLCEAFLGLLLLARGRTRRALGLLEPMAERYEADSRVMTWIAAAIARARLAERRPAAAVDAVLPALRSVERDGIWIWSAEIVPVSVLALRDAGRIDEAARLTAHAHAAVSGRDAPAAEAALRVSDGLLAEARGEIAVAVSLLDDAEQRWAALSRPYEAARARVRSGRLLLEHGDGGADRLTEALDRLQALGADWDAELVRHVLRRAGLLPAHRRGRRSYGTELSPREAEIAAMAAEGLQNREIAAVLHLSIKTVEGHLSSARRKLGTSPRSGAPTVPRPRRGTGTAS